MLHNKKRISQIKGQTTSTHYEDAKFLVMA